MTKLNRELRRELKAAAYGLEQLALEIFAAVGHKPASNLLPTMAKIEELHAQADRLRAYGDEVRDGAVARRKDSEITKG